MAPSVARAESACANQPEVRFYHWAWNAQMGLMFANGGKQSTPDSLMCKHGVNLKLIREDNTDTMQALLVSFAEELKSGEKNPKKGAHFVGIMGDGSAPFFKGLNDKLKLLGPDYYLYPNKLFSDQTHLNRAGAQVYTEALFHLVESKIRALQ